MSSAKEAYEKKEEGWKAEVKSLKESVEKRGEEVKSRELRQDNEIQLMQTQFEMVNTKYEDMKKLVGVLKKQLQERPVVEESVKPAEAETPFSPPQQNELTVRMKEMELREKSKDGRISSLELLIERLKKDAENNTSELMDLKMKNDELEKRSGRVKEVEAELHELQVKYNEMVDEYTEMREVVTDLRDEKVGDCCGL